MKKPSRKQIVIVLVVLLAVALLLLLFRTPPAEWERARQFGEYVESKGLIGVLALFIIAMLSTSIGLPRQFFAFAAGFAYGVPIGVLISSLAAICGCAITFFCSRRMLSGYVQSRYPNAISTLNGILEDDVFLKILVLRLQPLGTNLITNLCAGVTAIPARLFLTSSWIGYIPQMFVFSLLGAGVRIGSSTYILYSLSMLLLSIILGGWLYKRYAHDADTKETL